MFHSFEVEDQSVPVRVDKYISEKFDFLIRSKLKDEVSDLKINSKNSKLSTKIKNGDFIEFFYEKELVPDILPENIRLDIIYEDDNTIVLNKKCGVVVHPALGNYSGTLVNALMFYYKDFEKNFDDKSRLGIVHRLDKETSGLLIVAKNQRALEFYQNQFKQRLVEKKYIAILKGSINLNSGVIKNYIERSPSNRKKFSVSKEDNGKFSETHYKVLKRYKNYTYVEFNLKTGRTHQLRVHSNFLNSAILGDLVYGRKDKNFDSVDLMLHSYFLKIKIFGDKDFSEFKTEIPERFERVIEVLDRENF